MPNRPLPSVEECEWLARDYESTARVARGSGSRRMAEDDEVTALALRLLAALLRPYVALGPGGEAIEKYRAQLLKEAQRG